MNFPIRNLTHKIAEKKSRFVTKMAFESVQMCKFHRKVNLAKPPPFFFAPVRMDILNFGLKKAESHLQNTHSGSISLPKRPFYGLSDTIKKQPPEGGWQGEGGTLQAKV
jgi:hypothetical protein